MQQHLPFETRLDLADSQSEKLINLVQKSASSRDLVLPQSLKADELIWKSDYFLLDQVSLFKNLKEEQKFQVLKRLNQSLLTEIYFIERCGMYFAGKMCLLAESIQERALYNMMSADESLHYLWVSSISGPIDPSSYKDQPFLNFLNSVLETEEKNVLIAVVQVLLEGWGLRHYKKLAEFSHHAGATQAFTQIIKDEAVHHGGGLILFDPKKATPQSRQRLKDIMKVFFDMVRCGPQMVISSLQIELGHLSVDQKRRIFEELNASAESQKNLDFLKSLLITGRLPVETIEDLQQEKYFSSLSSQRCAEF